MSLLNTNTFTMQRMPIKQSGFFYDEEPLGWSPDSKKLMFIIMYPSARKSEFGFVDIETNKTKLIQLPDKILWVQSISWAPDGNSFFFYSGKKVKDRMINTIYQLDLNGSILWQHTQYELWAHPFISPDGKWLLYSQSTAVISDMQKFYLKNLVTGETSFILETHQPESELWSPEGESYWSPDSKWLAIPELIPSGEGKPVPPPLKRINLGLVTLIPAQFIPESHTEKIANLWLVNVENKIKLNLISDLDAKISGWSPDSQRILLRLYNPRNRQYVNLQQLDIETKKYADFRLTWERQGLLLPDGKYLQGDKNRLLLFSLEGKFIKQLFP
jgi:Tol biopolymer transport system component